MSGTEQECTESVECTICHGNKNRKGLGQVLQRKLTFLLGQINQEEDQNIPAVVEPASLNIAVGTQRNDVESNEENMNNISSSQESRSVRSTLHVDDLPLSRDVPWESSNMYNPSRDSQIRTKDIDIRGISSIHPVERGILDNDRRIMPDHRSSIPYYPHEGIHPPRTSTANRRDSSDNSSDDNRLQRGRGYSYERGRPPERER